MRAVHLLLLVALGLSAAPGARALTLAPGEPLTRAAVVDLVDRRLAAEAAGRLLIEIEAPGLPLGNRSAEVTEIRLAGLAHDPRSGRFEGALAGRTPDGRSFTLPLHGRAVEVVEVPTLIRRIARDEIIGPDDLDWLELPAARLPRGALLDAADLIGGEARRTLAAQRVLTGRDVGRPLLVRRGRAVRLRYALQGLTITTLGTALEDGAEGAVVRATNADSRRQIQGLVTGPDELTVAPGARGGGNGE